MHRDCVRKAVLHGYLARCAAIAPRIWLRPLPALLNEPMNHITAPRGYCSPFVAPMHSNLCYVLNTKMGLSAEAELSGLRAVAADASFPRVSGFTRH